MAIRGGSRAKIEFPALVGLISHPALGLVLYDTGYSEHFAAATRGFPECLYQMLSAPVLPARERLLAQLEERNISPGGKSGRSSFRIFTRTMWRG